MINHSRMALVGALGGTYISLAIADIDELTISDFALLNSADFKHPTEAIERYLKSIPRTPDKVGLSVAGTVRGDKIRMSHLPWRFTEKEILAATGADRVCVINEFDALALTLPHLSRFDLVELADGERVLHGTKLAIGAGTGFGAAAALWSDNGWQVLSGECRYVALPADEFANVSSTPLSAEDAFSGHGMVALYRHVCKTRNLEAACGTAPEITRAALVDDDPAATETLNIVVSRLGRFAGELALIYGARGGVYLGGGLPSNIVTALATPRFREAFEGEDGRRDYLKDIPVYAIKTGADTGLRGAALALARSLPARPAAGRRPLRAVSE